MRMMRIDAHPMRIGRCIRMANPSEFTLVSCIYNLQRNSLAKRRQAQEVSRRQGRNILRHGFGLNI